MHTRTYERNERTQGLYSVMQRSYCVPTAWTPPPAKGTFDPRYGTVTMLYAPTPGAGDPRVAGQRTVMNPSMSWAYYVQ